MSGCATARPSASSIAMPSGPRHRYEESGFSLAQDQTIGTGDAARKPVQDAVRGVAVDAAARIGEVALPLVGKVQIAVHREGQIVHALERLLVIARYHCRDAAAFRVERQDAEPVVGDEEPAVLVDGDAVRLAVVLGCHVELPAGRDPENAAKCQIDDVEIAFAV